MKGIVVHGTKNVFQVETDDGSRFECRFKGKILKEAEGFYNPLAPGDLVELETEGDSQGRALIVSLGERRNAFTRFNQKGQAPQLLASNLDLVFCVSSPASPPFRPRFLDRALLQADKAGIPAIVLLNKNDLSSGDPDTEERLEDFIRLGYRVLRVSATTGEGLDEMARLAAGRVSALVGQSGVGKSSLINALDSGAGLRTGEMCGKYDRGSHTTTMARLVAVRTVHGPGRIVDTPGVRRLMPDGIPADQLAFYLREFAPLVGRCTYGLSCSHEVEPGCKIMEAVAAGVIHEDRYDSFLRLRSEMGEYGD